MRILSTLISSLLFATAILEHLKLFVRAELALEREIWAGVGKVAHVGDGFTTVGASFNVPAVSGNRGDAFVGITLGSGQCGDATLSLGVVISLSEGQPTYRAGYQMFPNPIRISNNAGPIEDGDFISVHIISSGGGLPMVTIVNTTKKWPLDVPVEVPPWRSLCNRVAEWKVGTIRAGGTLAPLPNFLQVIYMLGFVISAGGTIQGAGQDSYESGISLGNQRVVQVEVNPNDAYFLEIKQL